MKILLLVLRNVSLCTCNNLLDGGDTTRQIFIVAFKNSSRLTFSVSKELFPPDDVAANDDDVAGVAIGLVVCMGVVG